MSLSPIEFPIVNAPAGMSAMPEGMASVAAFTLVNPPPLPEIVALVMLMPDTKFDAKAALPPFKLVASCHVAASSWLLVMALNRANGTEQLVRLLGCRLVTFSP